MLLYYVLCLSSEELSFFKHLMTYFFVSSFQTFLSFLIPVDSILLDGQNKRFRENNGGITCDLTQRLLNPAKRRQHELFGSGFFLHYIFISFVGSARSGTANKNNAISRFVARAQLHSLLGMRFVCDFYKMGHLVAAA